MSSNSAIKPIILNLNIGDQLTPISCGHIVVEIIKFFTYQRFQIPYTYQWLKQVVTRRKLSEKPVLKESLNSERHYRIASTALENLDFILKSLLQEINGSSMPDEVCICLGGSPVTCKEVYRLLLPKVCHKPQCHSHNISNDQKTHRNVFKALATSETMGSVIYSPLSTTNMYVYIKRKASSLNTVMESSHFVPASGYRIPRSSKIAVINFRAQNQDNLSCCNDFQVYGDVISEDMNHLQLQDNDIDYNEIESTKDYKWYQSTYIMKGFKDCVVNGASVTNSWLEY